MYDSTMLHFLLKYDSQHHNTKYVTLTYGSPSSHNFTIQDVCCHLFLINTDNSKENR